MIRDHYRKRDQKTVGFTLEFCDGRVVKWGKESDKSNIMRFNDTVATVQAFS